MKHCLNVARNRGRPRRRMKERGDSASLAALYSPRRSFNLIHSSSRRYVSLFKFNLKFKSWRGIICNNSIVSQNIDPSLLTISVLLTKEQGKLIDPDSINATDPYTPRMSSRPEGRAGHLPLTEKQYSQVSPIHDPCVL